MRCAMSYPWRGRASMADRISSSALPFFISREPACSDIYGSHTYYANSADSQMARSAPARAWRSLVVHRGSSIVDRSGCPVGRSTIDAGRWTMRDELNCPAMPLDPGTKLGLYEVTALLGEGGMGAVYRAR